MVVWKASSVDSPNCVAVLTHWRVFSTIINCVGEKKVSLPESADVSAEEKVSSLMDSSVKRKEEEMEVDPCNQSESGKLASSLALSEEAALLHSPTEEAKSMGSSILESPPKEKVVHDIG